MFALVRRLPPALGRRGLAAPAAPPLLAQLPDFTAGAEALEAGKFTEAQLMLQRASDVADAHFPEAAAPERALCHSALGRCLWNLGRYVEAAAQYEAGLAAARGRAPALATSHLAEAAARVRFELGHFEASASLVAEAMEESPGSDAALLISEALGVVNCGAKPPPMAGPLAAGDEVDVIFEATRRMNLLVGRGLPDEDEEVNISYREELASDEVWHELDEQGPLGNFLAASGEAPSLPLMALRSTGGQLAVASGQEGEPWARPLLVKALDDFEVLRPRGPTMGPVRFRTLGALGTLTARASHDAVAAEGLFRSAVDHIEEATLGELSHSLDLGRGPLWRAMVFWAYADLVQQGRQADQRSSEITALRQRAAAALGEEHSPAGPTRQQLRWALACLPPPEWLRAEELIGS